MPLEDETHLYAAEDDNQTSELLSNTSTQHRLTKSEIVKGMANRFMYSKFYIGLYLALAFLSFVSIVMSLRETCPSSLFIIFEAIINLAMIVEVSTRLLALGKNYWKSVWNMIDIVLVIVCAVTLLVLTTGCSIGERNEAIFDTMLLVIRNGFQLFRLFMMLRRNQYSIHARSTRIDFDDILDNNADNSTSLDRDLHDTFLDDEDSDLEHDLDNSDVAHSRTASDSSTSKLYNSPIEYNDPYYNKKQPNREPNRTNSYLPYSHHRRDPSQPPASSMYIEDYTPHTSTTLGVGSMLHDSLAEQIDNTRFTSPATAAAKQTDTIIQELAQNKKKKRKTFCCGLGYRSIAFIVILFIVVIAIIWYFVWPRVPNLSVSDVDDNMNIQVVTNSSIKYISTQWNMSLTADNSENWVPTRFDSIDFILSDERTSAVFGNGTLGSTVLSPKKKSLIIVPIDVYYETDSINDATFQDLYNACGVQISSNTPYENSQDLLNVTIHVTYHIAGIVWTPTANITVRGLGCPAS
ncbi:hypothetical protein G6F16_010277 [Rhizopus arrhizus]|nr:hypothetical protein G6F20_008613 [Rhizopus arrhizus]KAG0828209.1 hypothetical protein G6F18_009185 [Rhizopus arrhizus]KAG0865384.1 hypothetical protein G6F16_010277 [Rhizopus arrhizus]KAG0894051.1 hypothetical protein G6F34_009438 [Rhizopus arrhizus]KAG0961999.1 hypothetical protein G6F31_009099 [Rhizopus arrhizus]